MFANFRTPADIWRYVSIMGKVSESDVVCPKLHRTRDGVLFSDSGLSMVVMEFIKGKTFLEMNSAPNDGELRQVIGEIAKVNRIRFPELPYLFDSWSVQNLHGALNEVLPFVKNGEDLDLLEMAAAAWDEIPLDKLPKAFVHGDITKANIIRDKDGRCYLLDFSVANIYPRIQDLAVIAANLMAESGKSLTANANAALEIYDGFNKLEDIERKFFENYVIAAAGMEFLGGLRQKYLRNDNSGEADFWLGVGRDGLMSYQR
ncbi:MAG: phosphotransferase [Rickettsiales bacterium]|nr:phosphotransferase [Rickettsiales bacterium]